VLCVVKVFSHDTSGLSILRVKFIIRKQNYLLQGPQGDSGRCPRSLINHREKDSPTTTMKVIDVRTYLVREVKIIWPDVITHTCENQPVHWLGGQGNAWEMHTITHTLLHAKPIGFAYYIGQIWGSTVNQEKQAKGNGSCQSSPTVVGWDLGWSGS